MKLVPRTAPHAPATIATFLGAHLQTSLARGVVLGLSGGIDSAVLARLARDALGAERVLGLLLPDRSYPAELLGETAAYADSLGIPHRTISMEPLAATARQLLPDVTDRVALGNLTARLRMTVLYTVARKKGYLVIGTGNKSELLLGYYTKFGDGAADLLPLGDLYKTEIRQLARELGVPEAIQTRPPSAGFWEGQTDEDELGVTYAVADAVLLGFEELRSIEEIAQAVGVEPALVRALEERVARHRHKRRLPPIPKLRGRTLGIDWRD
ncbi:MAG: NAD+ synthase [Thermoplasmata archaeon]